MIHRCKLCNLPFSPLRSNQKYCIKCRRNGIVYYDKRPLEIKTCKICKKQFKTNYKKKVYCSTICRMDADTRHKEQELKICVECNEEFKTSRSNKIYCCVQCARLAKIKKDKEYNDAKRNKLS